MQRLLVLVTNGQLACSVIAIVVSSAPLVLLLARDDEIIGPTPAALATWYCITLGFALQLLFVFAFALYIKRKIKRAFDVSYQMNESEHILAMRNALLGVQNSAVVQSGVQCLIYLALGLFPFFYTKHDYWMPVGTLAYPIIGYKLAKTAINTGTGSSNNASGKSKESNQSSLAAHPSSKSDDKSFNFDSVKPPSSFGLGGSIAPQQGGGHGKRHSKASASERFEKNKSHYQEDRGGDEDEHSGDEYV